MKKLLIAALAIFALAASNTDYLTNTTTTPVNSTTAIAFNKGAMLNYVTAGAAVDTTHVTLGSGAIATNDIYNGFQLSTINNTGVVCSAGKYAGTIVGYVGSTKVAKISPASSVAIDPNCLVEVGAALPQNYRTICFGNGTGSLKWSTRIGGTTDPNSTDYATLAGGTSFCFSNNSPLPLIGFEVLSSASTDTVTIIRF